ncbi:hypothetical protein PR048_032163 [Dryococelus australis]|uniref:Uncharacterized protein n=1 Tax=Dryococelus australis TaxID=614101 RepID=A0ABQ9G1G2_9NEOP|nr:hypothetical protein PR048_032163 [Dryococelus australis]
MGKGGEGTLTVSMLALRRISLRRMTSAVKGTRHTMNTTTTANMMRATRVLWPMQASCSPRRRVRCSYRSSCKQHDTTPSGQGCQIGRFVTVWATSRQHDARDTRLVAHAGKLLAAPQGALLVPLQLQTARHDTEWPGLPDWAICHRLGYFKTT